MKASLVGFITCNGLNGPSESHLFITQVNLKFQVLIYLIFPFFSLHQPSRGLKKKWENEKANQVSTMEANLGSSSSSKEEACWNPPVEEEEEALEKSLQLRVARLGLGLEKWGERMWLLMEMEELRARRWLCLTSLEAMFEAWWPTKTNNMEWVLGRNGNGSNSNESKSCRIHQMQWLKWPFKIPPIHNTN